MAKPIKETPTISGKDAERFDKKIAQNEVNKASRSEYDRVMSNFNKIKKQAKF